MCIVCTHVQTKAFPRKESELRRRALIRQLSGVEELLMEFVAGRWQNAPLILDRLVDLVSPCLKLGV